MKFDKIWITVFSAIAVLISALSTGCDMGTYNRRFQERSNQHLDDPPAESSEGAEDE